MTGERGETFPRPVVRHILRELSRRVVPGGGVWRDASRRVDGADENGDGVWSGEEVYRLASSLLSDSGVGDGVVRDRMLRDALRGCVDTVR
jgi:hypothetical protein